MSSRRRQEPDTSYFDDWTRVYPVEYTDPKVMAKRTPPALHPSTEYELAFARGLMPYTMEWGSGGTNVGVMAAAGNAVVASLADIGFPAAHMGASSGFAVATAMAFNLSPKKIHDWVHEMLPTIQDLVATRPQVLDGLRRGGLFDQKEAIHGFMYRQTMELQREADAAGIDRDCMTFRGMELPRELSETVGLRYKLNVGVGLAWQRGMNVGPFDPKDIDRKTQEAARTLGLDVERNIFLRGRIPNVITTFIPETSSVFGWGPDTTIATGYVLGTSRTTGGSFIPLLWLDYRTGDVWVAVDGATNLWPTLSPSDEGRRRSVVRGVNMLSGPGAPVLKSPNFRFFVAGQGKHADPRIVVNPNEREPFSLELPVPGLYSAVHAKMTDEDIERTLAAGEEVGEAIVRSRVAPFYLEVFHDVNERFAALAEQFGDVPVSVPRTPQEFQAVRDAELERQSIIRGVIPTLCKIARVRMAPMPDEFPQLPLDRSSWGAMNSDFGLN